jgi:hypothetical protein
MLSGYVRDGGGRGKGQEIKEGKRKEEADPHIKEKDIF